jgi:hypothetical protein
MAQDTIKPDPQLIIENLEDIDFILSKKIEEKQSGTKEKRTDTSED